MSGFYSQSNEFAFKIPAVPPRYRRSQVTNTQSAFNHGDAVMLGMANSDDRLNKLQEKIDVLSKIYLPSDEIWEVLARTLNQLCYDKLAEAVLQPNSQRSSIFNGGSTCSSIYSQNIRSSERIRNNYSQSTVNTQDSRRCRSQNAFIAPVYQESEPEYIPSQGYMMQNKAFYEPESVPKTNTGRSCSRQRKLDATKENDATYESALCVPTAPKKKVDVSMAIAEKSSRTKRAETSHRINSRKQKHTEPNTFHDDPTSKKQKCTESDTFGSNVNSKKEKPTQPNVAQKNVSAIFERSSRRKKSSIDKRSHEHAIQDLNVLLSEDDNDSLTAFFQRKSKPAMKVTSTASTATASSTAPQPNTSKMNMSVTLNRVVVDEQVNSQSRKRQMSRPEDSNKRQCTESSASSSNSDGSTVIEQKKATTKTTRKRTTGSNTSKLSKAKAKPTKSKQTTQKVDATAEENQKNTVAKSRNSFKQMDDGSFFGDVSSIVGNSSVSLLHADKKKGADNKGADNDMPLHFFSPFANVRSTSGFSAISTPLSKSVAKNVLSKRLKKPSVAAELKDQLKPGRKRQLVKKPIIVQPTAHDTTAMTESECEVSDFDE